MALRDPENPEVAIGPDGELLEPEYVDLVDALTGQVVDRALAGWRLGEGGPSPDA